MCGIYCVYKQSRSCQLPFCAIFHFEIVCLLVYIYVMYNLYWLIRSHVGSSIIYRHNIVWE